MTQLTAREAAGGISKAVVPGSCLAATAAAGAGLAAWLPESSGPGLFLPLVALMAGAAVILGRDKKLGPQAWALATVGFALVSMSAVRAAVWLVVPDLLLALIFAALAVRDPHTWRAALAAVLSPSARVPRVPGMLVRSASRVVGSADSAKVVSLARGLLIAAVLVGVFGALFASADSAFLEMAARLLPDWDLGLLPVRVFLFGVGVAITSAFVLTRIAGPPEWLHTLLETGQNRLSSWKLGRVEWISALVLLDALFLSFMSVQIVVLFQGHDHILQTAGLTYAQYAREGFLQLLIATALVVPVIVLAWNWSARERRADEIVLKVLLGTLGLLTLGIVASAVRRLGLYEEAFGFTSARLAAHAIVLWLGALLLTMMAACLLNRTSWLFRSTLVLTATAILVFNFMNPEAMIARKNWERYQQTGKIDTYYLSGLSADAVPVLASLPDNIKGAALERLRERLADEEPWSSANLSRIRARSLLER